MEPVGGRELALPEALPGPVHSAQLCQRSAHFNHICKPLERLEHLSTVTLWTSSGAGIHSLVSLEPVLLSHLLSDKPANTCLPSPRWSHTPRLSSQQSLPIYSGSFKRFEVIRWQGTLNGLFLRLLAHLNWSFFPVCCSFTLLENHEMTRTRSTANSTGRSGGLLDTQLCEEQWV